MVLAILTFIVAFVHVVGGAIALYQYPQYKRMAISAIVLGFVYGGLTVAVIGL
ncbi:MAG: hypothetical protein WBV10_06530 [Exiguobacterium marinum]|jgi:hypothetical protein|uniref:Uncharacterized protein n=2 Tax=Exiguobacterium TaxID=33986 RepID=A0ABY7X276_9BACL|nr:MULTISPECIES: hypothetical protein [Exiguobacterium]MBR2758112.1 hypothetical protein [Exiguobacterium sp.]MCT4786924.1 hypothetical protein [Exiguobacterium aestuarii]WDH76229.1 hypothetical protein PTI97_01510 [Exiguobacterium marinum]